MKRYLFSLATVLLPLSALVGCGGQATVEDLVGATPGSDAGQDAAVEDASDEQSPPQEAGLEDASPDSEERDATTGEDVVSTDVEQPPRVPLPCPSFGNPGAACLFPPNACCVSFFSPTSGRCANPENPGWRGCDTPITCHSSRDCPAGQVCCATRKKVKTTPMSEDYRYVSVRCESSCGGKDKFQLCLPSQGATHCPDKTHCVQSHLLPQGYFVCSPK